MILLFFAVSSSTLIYSVTNNVLRITGTGEITQSGVRSREDFAKLIEVIIKDGPTSILSQAFLECYALRKITISKTVQTITTPFRRCKNLQTIIVDPENENYYSENNMLISKNSNGKELIRAPVNQKIIEIPEGIKRIKEFAFSTSKSYEYEQIIFADSLEELEGYSFIEMKAKLITCKNNPHITILRGFYYSTCTTITVPKSTLELYNDCFIGSTITNIVFQETSSLKTLKPNCFGSTTLRSIEFPDSLQIVDSNAFFQCPYLDNLSFGINLTTISSTAFAGCPLLTSVTIPENNPNFITENNVLMTSDRTQIMFISGSIESITIDAKVTTISSGLLQNQKSLKTLNVNSGNSVYQAYNNGLYTNNYSQLIDVCGGVESIEAHSELVVLGQSCCYGCSNLKYFIFPTTNSICKCTTINNSAFSSSGLVSFTLPDSVESIQYSAFDHCSSLQIFTITPNSKLNTLEYYAFRETNIKSIFIPKDVLEISSQCFEMSKITEVTFADDSKCHTMKKNSFYRVPLKQLVIPASMMNIYEYVFAICTELTTVTFKATSSLQSIGKNAFQGCSKLESIELPPSCHTINTKAFSGCTSLKFATNNASVIFSTAFENCVSLTNFTFSSIITSLDAGIFRGCTSLISFNVTVGNPSFKTKDGVVFSNDELTLTLFPPGVEEAVITRTTTKVAERAFAYSSKLRKVMFLSGNVIDTLPQYTFTECSQLSSIDFPPSLSVISSFCFNKCTNLWRITLPTSIREIEPSAFTGCTILTNIEYCGNETIQTVDAFDQSTFRKTVYVTVSYPSSSFCGLPIKRTFSNTCTILPDKLNARTCNVNKRSVSVHYYLVVVLLDVQSS